MQDYDNMECIILNDGSTDNSAQLIRTIINGDSRFLFVEQMNRGLPASRNVLIDKANGEYIQFLDSDDVISKNKISRQVEIHSRFSDYKISYTNFCFGHGDNINNIKPNCDILELKTGSEIDDFITRWESELTVPPHCFLIDLNFIKSNNIKFDERLKNHEDFDFWLKLFYLKPKMFFLNEVLCTYRNSAFSMSKNMRLMGEGFLFVLEEHLKKENEYSCALNSKRRDVIVFYRRFDKMKFIDFLLRFKQVIGYYSKRMIQKLS